MFDLFQWNRSKGIVLCAPHVNSRGVGAPDGTYSKGEGKNEDNRELHLVLAGGGLQRIVGSSQETEQVNISYLFSIDTQRESLFGSMYHKHSTL